jgi:ABC-type glucose/galactose transport system permease subunit
VKIGAITLETIHKDLESMKKESLLKRFLIVINILLLFSLSVYIGLVKGLNSAQIGDSNLTIWDLSDNQIVYANYSIFYANWTNSSLGGVTA